MKALVMILFLLSASWACKNHNTYPSFSENGNPMMVVEIPAGTNEIYEYNPQTNKFEPDEVDGNTRTIKFLPFPGNYGFVPSTSTGASSADYDEPLDVLVIASNIKRGSLLEFVPIGVLKVENNNGEVETIIGIAINSEVDIVHCNTRNCLQSSYPGIEEILETWFRNYQGDTSASIKSWEDEKYAIDLIKKWQKTVSN